MFTRKIPGQPGFEWVVFHEKRTARGYRNAEKRSRSKTRAMLFAMSWRYLRYDTTVYQERSRPVLDMDSFIG